MEVARLVAWVEKKFNSPLFFDMSMVHVNAAQAGNIVKFQDKFHPPFREVKGKQTGIAKLLDAMGIAESFFRFFARHKFVKTARSKVSARELPNKLGECHKIGRADTQCMGHFFR